jgi:c-di-AMP phosphodiesterase-like protein
MLGEQGTGKPLFARMVANILQQKANKVVKLKDLELHEIEESDEHMIYMFDVSNPNEFPSKPEEFFDLIIMIPNQFEQTMEQVKKFSPTIHELIHDTLHKGANPLLVKGYNI